MGFAALFALQKKDVAALQKRTQRGPLSLLRDPLRQKTRVSP